MRALCECGHVITEFPDVTVLSSASPVGRVTKLFFYDPPSPSSPTECVSEQNGQGEETAEKEERALQTPSPSVQVHPLALSSLLSHACTHTHIPAH